MTKVFMYHRKLTMVLKSYQEHNIDLRTCSRLVKCIHQVAYGRPMDSMSLHQFNNPELRFFLTLCYLHR